MPRAKNEFKFDFDIFMLILFVPCYEDVWLFGVNVKFVLFLSFKFDKWA